MATPHPKSERYDNARLLLPSPLVEEEEDAEVDAAPPRLVIVSICCSHFTKKCCVCI